MKATDGDTLRMSFRLHGIDTPERDQICKRNGECYRCGQEATTAMRALIDGKDVRCEPTGDRTWDRLVAVCYVGNLDLGEEMIRLGWAVRTKHLEDASLERRLDYAIAGQEARGDSRGLWAGEFLEPQYWRKGERLEGCE